MKNCLVTKLKESVNNDNLEVLGVLKIHISPRTSSQTQSWDNRFYFSYNGNLNIKTADNSNKLLNAWGETPVSSISLSNPINLAIFFEDGEYDVLIESKYNIVNLNYIPDDISLSSRFSINWDSLKFISNLKGINAVSELTSGNFSDISNLTQLEGIKAYKNITGNLSELSKLTNIKELELTNCKRITGSIQSINTLSKLKNVNFGGDSNIEGDITNIAQSNITNVILWGTKIDGTIESFAEAVITKKPDKSGTCLVRCNDYIKYNNVVVGNGQDKTITFDGQGGYTVA